MKIEKFQSELTAKNRFETLKDSADKIQLYKKGAEYVVVSDEDYILIDEYTKPDPVVSDPEDPKP